MVRVVPILPARHGPEAQVLLCCARTRVSPDSADRLAALLERSLHWRYLTEAAAAHRILPLLHNSLSTAGSAGVPADVRADLHARVLADAERDSRLAGELVRLLGAFQAAGVRVIPFKGPALAASVYPSLALRRFYDLDILIHPRDLLEARRVLRASGYRPEGHRADGWEEHYVEQRGGWVVDLHQRIAPRYFPEVASFGSLLARCRTVVIHDRSIATLGAVDLLLVLSVQLVKDCRTWKQRLVQICDTAELIRSCPDMDWDAGLRQARASGALRMLLLNVLLASELLDADVPEPVRRLSRTDPVVPALAADVGRRLFPPPAEAGRVLPIGVGMTPRVDTWFYLRARERLRDRIGHLGLLLWSRVSLLVTPTDSDRTWIRLPKGLGLLYYVVRPARVLLQGIRTGHLKSPPVTPDGAPPCESVRVSARS